MPQPDPNNPYPGPPTPAPGQPDPKGPQPCAEGLSTDKDLDAVAEEQQAAEETAQPEA